MSVGGPQHQLLHVFGSLVWGFFDTPPFQVGSSATSKDWRDVDVVAILDDDEYERRMGPFRLPYEDNPRWSPLCLAFSALGRQVTGLTIDFKVQQLSDANERHKGPRNSIGLLAPGRVAPQAQGEG